MKSIKLLIPRILIRGIYKHPESYGDSIIELDNGMTTDVYKNDDGSYFTITNNEELISYIKNKEKDFSSFVLVSNEITLRTPTKDDLDVIIKFYKSNMSNHKNIISFDRYDAYLYLNNMITDNSHLLIIDFDNNSVGAITYHISNNYKLAWIEIVLFSYKILSNTIKDKIIKLIINHLKDNYIINEINIEIPIGNKDLLYSLVRNNFAKLKNGITTRFSFDNVKYQGIILNLIC